MWWNAHGLNKHTRQLNQYMIDHEITMCGVTETWIYDQDVFCNGYYWSKGHENPPHAVTSRVAGGMGVLCASGLNAVVVRTDRHAMWVRVELAPAVLNSHRITNSPPRYLFVATVYAPQHSSVQSRANRDVMWRELRAAVNEYRRAGMVVIGGDLNGRTAANGDTICNAAGKEIEDFCSSLDLINANHLDGATGEFSFHEQIRSRRGGKAGDPSVALSGHASRVRKSTVDYALIDANHELIPSLSFTIEEDWFTLSDHRPIVLSLSPHALFSRDPSSAPTASSSKPTASAPATSARRAQRTRWKSKLDRDALTAAFNVCGAQWLQERERTMRDRASNTITTRAAIDRVAIAFSSAATAALHKAVGAVPDRDDRSSEPRSPFHFRSAQYDRLVKRCQTAGRRWQRSKRNADSEHTATYEHEYVTLRDERRAMASRLLAAAKDRYLKRIEEEAKVDPQRFWRAHGQVFRSNSFVSKEARRLPHSVFGPSGRGELITAPEEVLEQWRATFNAVSTPEPPTAQHAIDFEREVQESLRVSFDRLPESTRSAALTSLESTVTADEVAAAIKRMRRNAASGADSIPASFFKDGGPRVIECVTLLLNDVLSCGEWPCDWLLGWIVPIYKKGVKADTTNYRGITLLPALDKLCRSVLNHRLSTAIESSHLLSDYQVGFRARHGTMDHLITLNELITAHRECKQPLYLGFLDVAKAYDHTWRDGLWWRLRRIGVTDKLLRVWRSSYDHVRRAVLIDDQITDEFECGAGVAQGAIDSPTLYDVFVDELAATLLFRGFGVTLGAGERVPLLMYADDMVLLASTPEQLQRMLDVVSVFAERWQFSYNASKSAVVVAAHPTSTVKIDARSYVWRLAGQRLPVLDQYKYLGLEIGAVDEGRWNGVIDRIVRATKGRGQRLLWAHGNRYGLYPALQMRLWHATCRPLLEYGCALWGSQLSDKQCRRIDSLQTTYARSVLGLDDMSFVSDAFVNAELGLCSLSSRRDELTLRMFGSILSMSPAHSLVTRVVRHRLSQAVTSDDHTARKSWVQLIRPVFERYGLLDAWTTGDVGDVGEWRTKCHKVVRQRLKAEWPSTVAGHASLALYSTLKHHPYRESYLDRSTNNREGRRLKLLLRSGALALMNTIGDRLELAADSEVRQCWMCRSRDPSTAPIEDPHHFLMCCPALADLRIQLFDYVMLALRRESQVLLEWFTSAPHTDRLAFVAGGDMLAFRPPAPLHSSHPPSPLSRARTDPSSARERELYNAMTDSAVGTIVDRAFQNFLLRAWRRRDVLSGGRWVLEFEPKAAEAVARVNKAHCTLNPNTTDLSHLPLSLMPAPAPSSSSSSAPVMVSRHVRDSDRIGGPNEFVSESESENGDGDDDSEREHASTSEDDSASASASPNPDANAPPAHRRLPVLEALSRGVSSGASKVKHPLLLFYAIAHIDRRRVSSGIGLSTHHDRARHPTQSLRGA